MLTAYEKYIIRIMREDVEKAAKLIAWAEECHRLFDGVPLMPDGMP